MGVLIVLASVAVGLAVGFPAGLSATIYVLFKHDLINDDRAKAWIARNRKERGNG